MLRGRGLWGVGLFGGRQNGRSADKWKEGVGGGGGVKWSDLIEKGSVIACLEIQ